MKKKITKQKLKKKVVAKIDTKFDLTVCMPTFNGSDTIQKAIHSLFIQGLNLRIIIADNGSTDGTNEMITTAIANGWYGHHTVELHNPGRVVGDSRANISHTRKYLIKQVNTKFMFWLDDDLMLPPNGLKFVLDMAEMTKKIGMIGLQYQMFRPHLAIGASLMHTGLAKQLTYTSAANQRCECNGVLETIRKKGYQAMSMNRISAINVL